MSIAALWDRFWWSLMLTIGLGLIWLKYINPVVPCVSVGLIVCIALGLAYFARGVWKMRQQRQAELKIEEIAHQELLAELEGEADHA